MEEVVGKDYSELFVNQNTDDFEIESNGKVWKFVKKEVSRAEKNKALSDATSYDTGKAAFDIDVYIRSYLCKMLVKAPFPINMTTLSRLNDEVGKKLESFVPQPFDSVLGSALKNVSSSSSKEEGL